MNGSPPIAEASEHAIRLLAAEPIVPVPGCPELRAHCASNTFLLWERWEQLSHGTRPPPFWATVWPGAALLARVLLDEPWRVRGRRAIDVGCGGGVVAVAAARAGASRVVANDVVPEALLATQLNASLNAVTLDIELRDLSRKPDYFRETDVVLLCEVFYERNAAEDMRRLARNARRRGAHVIVADGGRAFFDEAGLCAMREETIEVDLALEGVRHRRASVFEWVGSP